MLCSLSHAASPACLLTQTCDGGAVTQESGSAVSEVPDYVSKHIPAHYANYNPSPDLNLDCYPITDPVRSLTAEPWPSAYLNPKGKIHSSKHTPDPPAVMRIFMMLEN